MVLKQHFIIASDAEKEHLMAIRKSKSTNDSTRQWVATFQQFLKQEEYEELDKIGNEELKEILECFYTFLHILKGEKYKSTTLKAMRVALN